MTFEAEAHFFFFFIAALPLALLIALQLHADICHNQRGN
jgi:hypothetical protein